MPELNIQQSQYDVNLYTGQVLRSLGFNFEHANGNKYVPYHYSEKIKDTKCISINYSDSHRKFFARGLNAAISRHINKTEIEYDNNLTIGQNAGRFRDGDVAMVQYPGSNVLAIDFDNHSVKNLTASPEERDNLYQKNLFATKQICNAIQNVSGQTPIFVEISRFGTGSHIFIKLTTGSHPAFKDTLKQYVKTITGYGIEFRTESHALRIPFASDYESLDSLSLKRIDNLTALSSIPVKYSSTESINPSRCINRMNEFIDKKSNENKSSIFEISKKSDTIRFKIPEERIERTDFVNYVKKHYLITSGNRIGGQGNQIRIAFLAHSHNIDFPSYKKAVMSANAGSKDLSSWSENRIEKDLLYTFDWTEARYDECSTKQFKSDEEKTVFWTAERTKFISSIQWLDSNMSESIGNIAERIADCNVSERYRDSAKKSLKLILGEIFGKAIYEKNRNRQVRSNVMLRKSTKDGLESGVAFSKVWLKDLQDFHSDVKNVNRYYRMILKELTETGVFERVSGYSNFDGIHYCIHYKVNTSILKTEKKTDKEKEEEETDDVNRLYSQTVREAVNNVVDIQTLRRIKSGFTENVKQKSLQVSVKDYISKHFPDIKSYDSSKLSEILGRGGLPVGVRKKIYLLCGKARIKECNRKTLGTNNRLNFNQFITSSRYKKREIT